MKITVAILFEHWPGEALGCSGLFVGLSTLAMAAGMSNFNGCRYMALMDQYGEPRNLGAYSIMSLKPEPFLPMVTLGAADLSAFPWPTLVGSILPRLFGMPLGKLDGEMRALLSRAVPAMIPFLAVALGSGRDLTKVWQARLLGLGLAVVVLAGILLFPADRATGGSGVAAASTAGNAAAVPVIVAAADLAYAEAVAHAPILVAPAVVLTTALVLLWAAKVMGTRPEGVPATTMPAE
jgi:2-keto-3-deoxygluconate permease